MIYIITPHHRSSDTQNIIKNIKCQSEKGFILVLFQNGQMADEPPPPDLDCRMHFFQTDHRHHISTIRNMCLDVIKRNYTEDFDFWCHMDSDDEYGPEYLAELKQTMSKYDDSYLIGKNKHWTQTKTKGRFLYDPGWSGYLHGSTLASKNLTHLFPITADPWGEDMQYLSYFPLDKRISTSIDNYTYIRNDNGRNHTWNATDWQIYDQSFATTKTY